MVTQGAAKWRLLHIATQWKMGSLCWGKKNKLPDLGFRAGYKALGVRVCRSTGGAGFNWKTLELGHLVRGVSAGSSWTMTLSSRSSSS